MCAINTLFTKVDFLRLIFFFYIKNIKNDFLKWQEIAEHYASFFIAEFYYKTMKSRTGFIIQVKSSLRRLTLTKQDHLTYGSEFRGFELVKIEAGSHLQAMVVFSIP